MTYIQSDKVKDSYFSEQEIADGKNTATIALPMLDFTFFYKCKHVWMECNRKKLEVSFTCSACGNTVVVTALPLSEGVYSVLDDLLDMAREVDKKT